MVSIEFPTPRPTIVGESLNPDGLCVVHSTNYLPAVNDDGSISLKSSYIATNGHNSRNTVHFALNHKVTSHAASWDDTKYAIIAPFQDMLAQNGAPPTLNTVDSFWPTNSRDSLRIPNAILVMPSEGADELVVKKGNCLTFKTKNYTPEEEAILYGATYLGDTYISGCSYKKISDIEDRVERDRILSERAHSYAISYAIQSLGFQVEEGGMWSWGRSDYTWQHAQNLTDTIGSKNCLPHEKTEYDRLSKKMDDYLNVADYFEARAGIDGKTLFQDGDHVYISDASGTGIGHGSKFVLEFTAERIEESLLNLKEIAIGLDPKTQDVVKDFSARIIDRVSFAKSLIPESPKEPVAVNGAAYTTPAPPPASQGPISQKRFLSV